MIDFLTIGLLLTLVIMVWRVIWRISTLIDLFKLAVKAFGARRGYRCMLYLMAEAMRSETLLGLSIGYLSTTRRSVWTGILSASR